jgi:hypothetical protein
VADEQEKAVNAEATKIGREAEEANAIAQQAGMGLLREWMRAEGQHISAPSTPISLFDQPS